MYKNGYSVDKDEEKYKSIIEELYPLVKDLQMLGDPVPEVFTRLAGIRVNPFFGNLNIMKWMIEDISKLRLQREENKFDSWMRESCLRRRFGRLRRKAVLHRSV